MISNSVHTVLLKKHPMSVALAFLTPSGSGKARVLTNDDPHPKISPNQRRQMV